MKKKPRDIKAIAAAARQRIEERKQTHFLIPKHITCNCGHKRKDHYNEVGFCHHSQHENPGKCGCTWYWPNDRYLKTLKGKGITLIRLS